MAEAKHRRCWTLVSMNFSPDVPKREITRGMEVEISRMSPGVGIVILSGAGVLLKETGSKRTVMGLLKEGDAAGVVPDDKNARSHTVLRASTNVVIGAAKWELLESNLENTDPLEFKVRGFLKKDILYVNKKAYLVPDPVQRVARFFWMLSDANPDKKVKGAVNIPWDLKELSKYLHMLEVELALAIGFLAGEGAISLGSESFNVLSQKILENFCRW